MRIRGPEITAILFILAILTFVGCASTGKSRNETASESTTQSVPQEYVDVYGLGGDDWAPVWSPEIERSRLETPSDSTGDAGNQTKAAEEETRQGRGYRVQLINVLDEAEAQMIKLQASDYFDRVYIIFRSPNYKVRAGNFRTKAEADAAADSARAHGFTGAWVVPSVIELFPENKSVTKPDSLETDPAATTEPEK